MTNLECVMAVLESHREARRWNDETVAIDILAQLGVDDVGQAPNAAPVQDDDHETVHGPDADPFVPATLHDAPHE